MTVAGLGALLLALWLLLWGQLSLANILSGVLVVGLVLGVAPETRWRRRGRGLRPLPALRFAGHVLVGAARANAVLIREVVTPSSQINTGVVAVPLAGAADGLLTLVANVLALTPGTMPVEVTDQPPVIYVHVLHLDDIEQVRADVTRLAELALDAFPTVATTPSVGHPPTGGRP